MADAIFIVTLVKASLEEKVGSKGKIGGYIF
jgi:hypothetical protein